MNRETFIDGNKTILDTDFYLYLLQCEVNKNKLISFLENKKNQYKKTSPDINSFEYGEKYGRFWAFQEVLNFIENGGKDE